MIYTADDFDYSAISSAEVERLPAGRPSKGKKRRYLSIFGTFDIETTNITAIEQAVMYVWQVCLNGTLIMGRTWREFSRFLQNCEKNIPDGARLVMYIHNAAYEFQFLRNVYNFTEDDVFAVKSRRPVRFDIGRIEFRCSYFLTNMSLREFCKNESPGAKDRIRLSCTALPVDTVDG